MCLHGFGCRLVFAVGELSTQGSMFAVLVWSNGASPQPTVTVCAVSQCVLVTQGSGFFDANCVVFRI